MSTSAAATSINFAAAATGCVAYDPAYGTAYGYVPSLAAGIIFCVLFGGSMFAHIIQAAMLKVPVEAMVPLDSTDSAVVAHETEGWNGTFNEEWDGIATAGQGEKKKRGLFGRGKKGEKSVKKAKKHGGRQWWMLVFAIGALTELLGWAGRTWNAECPYNNTAFIMQISTLIIAPAFFTAGIYIILGRLIQRLGRATSLLSARAYLYIFCTCDVGSLVIQAIGGGMASVAFGETPPGNTALGTHIMVAGIIFQMASIAVFTLFYVDFLRRCARLKLKLAGGLRWLVVASAVGVLLILIRSVYRTIELLQGWSGYLITHEGYFVGFDGVLMALTVIVFNVAHPGWLLRLQPRSGVMSEKMDNRVVPEPEFRGIGSGEDMEGATLYSGTQTPAANDEQKSRVGHAV